MHHRACVPYVLAVSLGLTAAATAHGNTRGEAKVSLAGKPIVVNYGRPSLNGRDMLGKAAAEVPLQSSPLDKSVEVFTIDLAEEQGQGVFRMSWGNLALATRFAAK